MRLFYFIYYLKVLDWKKLNHFQSYLKSEKEISISIINQWFLILYNSLKYKISILEYYQFRFFEKNHDEKLKWAGTGFMYEYQKIMNPIDKRDILDDKRKFFNSYREFFVNKVFTLKDLENNTSLSNEVLKFNKIVFKQSDGKCGTSVKIIKSEAIEPQELVNFMKLNQFDMVESFIEQHEEMNRLSPSAVNTVRIFTELSEDNKVKILGCRQRISINSHIDNMAAGNIAAPIDEKTGIICGPGVYSDITLEPEKVHPITKVEIVGFQIPFWEECINLAINAAKKHPQNKSIGWDIVVTPSGPGLIEGNHDWCKLVWQLPVNQGLKHLLSLK